jgi:hypothetical protein
VVGVLELRANDALDKTRLEAKKTRSRRRNVIEVTATWDTLENSLLLFFTHRRLHCSARTSRVEQLMQPTDGPMQENHPYCDGK